MSIEHDLGAHEPIDTNDVTEWDFESEVVVIGHGGGGATAAIEANRNGMDVLVVEKTESGGGTTEAAGGYFYLGGGTPLQNKHDIDDSAQEMAKYLQARNPNTDSDRIQLFAENSVDHFHWLTDLGLDFEGPLIETKTLEPQGNYLKYSGSEDCYPFNMMADPAPRGHHIKNGGRQLFERLDETARSEGIDFLFETPATHLIMDFDHRRIVGVAVEREGEETAIRATDGVVIATSGFSFNEDMVAEHAPEYVDKGIPLGTGFINYPGASLHDGSGIKMAEAVGAKTSNMDKMVSWVFVNPYIEFPPDDGSLNEALVSGILVNGDGRRFIAEDRYGADIGQRLIEAEHAEELEGNPTSAHLILDDALFEKGGGVPDDNIVDFDPDTLVKAETIRGLAEKIDLPPAILENTVRFYSDQAADNEDSEYHKNEKYLQPIDEGPYYAYNLRPSAFSGDGVAYHTLGGIETTVDGQVLNSSNETIDGLYAASRSVAGIPGESYESGISLSTITYFGRRVGQSIADNSSG
jgi:3-oxo-5alpha-steroid 4-dehydrogenase